MTAIDISKQLGIQVFTLVGVQFQQPGHYKFVVNLGNLPPHETPFAVVEAPPPPGGMPPV